MASLWLVTFWVSLLCLHGSAQPILPQEPDFECVDIYKQPAFRHPLLKDHKIQMKPSVATMEALRKNGREEEKRSSSWGKLKDLCPEGQVPIQNLRNRNQSYEIMSAEFPGQHFAAMEMGEDGKKVYYGAGATMSVHAPRVVNNQYSRASIWFESGPTNERNSVQFGWAAHSRIYADMRPRLTVFWTADGYKRTGCYNTLCPGFIQIDKQVYVGMQMLPRTSNGGPEFVAKLSVVQESTTGNWLLMQDEQKVIGYWPKEVFTHLNNGATFIRYGGNVFGSPDGISPPMGNGRFPPAAAPAYKTAAFFARCKYMTERSAAVDVSGSAVRVVGDACYKIQDFGNQIPGLGPMFGYGGAGGQCGN